MANVHVFFVFFLMDIDHLVGKMWQAVVKVTGGFRYHSTDSCPSLKEVCKLIVKKRY